MVREHQHLAGAGQVVEHLQASHRALIIEVDEEIVSDERRGGVFLQLAVNRHKSHWSSAAHPAVLALLRTVLTVYIPRRDEYS